MEEKDRRKLYLPRGVKKGRDIIEGIGLKEIKDMIVVLIFLSIPTSIVYLIRGDTKFLFLVASLLVILSVGICAKVEYISLYTMLKNVIRYHKSKKMYKYHGYRR